MHRRSNSKRYLKAIEALLDVNELDNQEKIRSCYCSYQRISDFTHKRHERLNSALYILLTKREGRTGRISARGLDSTDRAQELYE